MDKNTKEKDIFYIFEGSIILKGFHAIIEIISGLFIFFISQNFIIQTVIRITHDEISEDSKDFIANYLIHAAQNFSISPKHFISFYLLSHGIIKGILVLNLLKKKLWAYPASIFVFGFFVIYQMFRYTNTHSVWLIIFTIFDLLVIWLIWHEYKIQRAKIKQEVS